MTEQDKKALLADPDGLKAYEYIANNIDTVLPDLDFVIDCMAKADASGQFMASAARYLHAIDANAFAPYIQRLVAQVIDRDRERRYLSDILQGIYGPDYEQRATELSATDDNFRRIYKRLFPSVSSF